MSGRRTGNTRGMNTVFFPPYRGLLKSLRDELARLGPGLPIVLCIGSDRLTGDCLGPLVGRALTVEYDVPTFVYGTLARTVTALNLRETAAFIRSAHPGVPLLVVDASLGAESEIGSVRLTRGGIRPGAASGKTFEPHGDLAITAVVNALPGSTLASTRLGTVADLAGVIAVNLAAALLTRPTGKGTGLAPMRARCGTPAACPPETPCAAAT